MKKIFAASVLTTATLLGSSSGQAQTVPVTNTLNRESSTKLSDALQNVISNLPIANSLSSIGQGSLEQKGLGAILSQVVGQTGSLTNQDLLKQLEKISTDPAIQQDLSEKDAPAPYVPSSAPPSGPQHKPQF